MVKVSDPIIVSVLSSVGAVMAYDWSLVRDKSPIS